MFTNKKIFTSNLEVKINDIHIKKVTCPKFLGVLIYNKLTWKENMFTLCNKCSKSIATIHKVSPLLSSSVLYALYYSLFLPYLNYCLEVWGNTYKSNLMTIFLKQKRIIRMCWWYSVGSHPPSAYKFNTTEVDAFHLMQIVSLPLQIRWLFIMFRN